MKKFTKLGALLTVVLAITMLLTVSAFATKLVDIKGHWAEEFIEYGVEAGYISGYSDGTFLPDKTVTRAEFSKMLNGAMGINTSGNARGDFSDIKTTDWFFDDVRKAEYAGYITGYEDGTFRPNNNITRQEAAVILSRVVLEVENDGDLSMFKDGYTVDFWAEDAVAMIAAKGYISGDDNKNFLPKGALTRSQAAKLIYQIVENEKIKNGDAWSDSDETYEDLIFTHKVILKATNGEDMEVVLDNCRVLGAVSIESEGVTLVINGDINELDVYETADITIQSGSVKKINILKGAEGTTVTLTRGVVIGKATNNAAVSYEGTGVIENSQEDAEGVVYGKNVTVEKTTGKYGSSDDKNNNNKNDDDDDDNKTEVDIFDVDNITFSPVSGAKNVSLSKTITITFDGKVYDKDGDALTEDYIEDEFELRRSSATSGTKLAFSASINSSSTKITIDPTSNFTNDYKYYVVIPAGVLTDANGNSNKKISSYSFETVSLDDDDDDEGSAADSTGVTITFDPKGGDKDVSVDSKIEITFSKKVYQDDDEEELDEEYCQDTAFEIRKAKSTGEKVDFAAEISSNGRTVTLVPESMLEPDTRYYVIVVDKKLYTDKGDKIAKKQIYFDTDDSLAMTITPENGATGVDPKPEIVITFAENVLDDRKDAIDNDYVEDEVVELREGSATGNTVDFKADVKNGRKIVITPDELDLGIKYYVIVNAKTLIGEDSGAENDKVTSSFTVAKATTPIVKPVSGAKGVGIDESITITFSDGLYTSSSSTSRKEVDANYIESEGAIKLRRKTSSGTVIDCDITVDNGVVTLEPKEQLNMGTTYYVVVSSSKFYTSDKKAYSTITTSFETMAEFEPEISPEDEDEDVDLDEKIVIEYPFSVFEKSGSKLKDLTSRYIVQDVVKLYKDSEGGEEVRFTASVNKTNTVITLTPEEDFESNTTYVVVVAGGKLTNENDEVNPGKKISFTTKVVIDKTITFTPKSGATNVSVNVKPTIEFGSPLYDNRCADIDDDYATEHIIICEGTKVGDYENKVEGYTVEVSNNDKTFTINADLKENQKYYVYILADSFMYTDEKTEVGAKNFNFTTIKAMPEIESVAVVDDKTTTDSVTLEVVCNCSGEVIVEIDGKKVASEKVTLKSTETSKTVNVTVEDLEAGEEYEAEVYVVAYDIESEREEVTIETLFDCDYCEDDADHNTEDHKCSFCGEEGHEKPKDEHELCADCGEYHEDEVEEWCSECEMHGHDSERYCGECGGHDGHEDGCNPEQE